MMKKFLIGAVFVLLTSGVAFAQDPCSEADPCAGTDPCAGGDPCSGATDIDTEEMDTGAENMEVEEIGTTLPGQSTQFIHRPLVLPKGRLIIGGVVDINLSDGRTFKDFGIAPDIKYGYSDELTLAVYHSSFDRTFLAGGSGGAFGTFGGGLCFGDICNDAWDGLDLDARYLLQTGKVDLAARGGLNIRGLSGDNVLLGLRLGLSGRYMAGELAILFEPAITIGVTERDAPINNKETIALPVAVMYQSSPELALFANAGIFAPLDGFDDAWALGVGVGAWYAVDAKLDVGATLSFPRIAGASGVGTTDARVIGLLANYTVQ